MFIKIIWFIKKTAHSNFQTFSRRHSINPCPIFIQVFVNWTADDYNCKIDDIVDRLHGKQNAYKTKTFLNELNWIMNIIDPACLNDRELCKSMKDFGRFVMVHRYNFYATTFLK